MLQHLGSPEAERTETVVSKGSCQRTCDKTRHRLDRQRERSTEDASKRVAHMDLKSSHIIIDENAKVWIVDYDLSEIFDGAEQTVSEFRGTRGWTAPEVGRRTYDPFLADVWATGKVIQELCADNVDHQDIVFLQTISTKLMKRNPKRRATIQEVLRMLVNQQN